MFDRVAETGAMEIRPGQPVVEKGQMKLPALQNPADFLLIRGRGEIGARVRMAPGTDEIGAIPGL